MNDEGVKYLKRISILSQGVKFERKFKWTDSAFQERLLRFGREMKLFDPYMDETDDVEACVIASLKEDIILKT